MTSPLAAARAVGAETVARHADDVDAKSRFPSEAFAALKQAKLLGMLVPKSEGGAGAGLGEVSDGIDSFMGKIVNRPKYVTELGKKIMFPIPSALGAFTGYKLSYLLLALLVK